MATCPTCGSDQSEKYYRDRLGYKELDPHRLKCAACGKVYYI